jgi:hypothetical protein
MKEMNYFIFTLSAGIEEIITEESRFRFLLSKRIGVSDVVC